MTKVTCILGHIQLVGGTPDVTLDVSSAKGNSTRWVFDVEQDSDAPLDVRLVGFHRPMPLRAGTLLGPNHSALNETAARSAIYFPNPTPEMLRVCAVRHAPLDPSAASPMCYRVTVDTFHTSTR